ncbi:MAG: HEPN domain-containing protein [Actinomycetota bacterium]
MREGGRHNLACFHSQQAAEKALKAFLVLREADPPRLSTGRTRMRPSNGPRTS